MVRLQCGQHAGRTGRHYRLLRGGFGTIAVHGATSGTNLDGLYVNNVVLFAVFTIPTLLVAVFDYTLLLGAVSS
ncbi:hypothetical protein [Paenibacillus popilliae]|uniref:3-deoxy-D-arabino-heptulosonate 7-phosphate synthase n=1 Tax=Paenibacillus popilliae ATCC 14706 TaxID=1212764 RepID=M9LQ19_PAEPP|nr:hypothetical protein [Paenibacillus popilliae]GAC42726.1 3-deoxy-D-arabino-heptulosonate 7-phosphate synthase [Paenibacillus popilliae ATCC 14706]